MSESRIPFPARRLRQPHDRRARLWREDSRNNRINVARIDGHVDAARRTFTWKSGMYPPTADAGIGWFGDADDNSGFDYGR